MAPVAEISLPEEDEFGEVISAKEPYEHEAQSEKRAETSQKVRKPTVKI